MFRRKTFVSHVILHAQLSFLFFLSEMVVVVVVSGHVISCPRHSHCFQTLISVS